MGKDIHSLRDITSELAGEYGLGHSLRIIELVRQISGGAPYNADIIAFCAYVHDFGAYARYAVEGRDHAARSDEVLPGYMEMFDFSAEEQAIIHETVLNHHNPAKLKSAEAVLFRDADALDFMGAIGIARDIARAGKDIKKGIASIRTHRAKLPGNLTLEASKRLGESRIREMDDFLSRYEAETFGI